MTANFYISGLITPTYTPLRRGRVAMAKKRDGSGGCGQVLLSERRFFRLHNPDTNKRTLKRAVLQVIGLWIKRLFPDIVSAPDPASEREIIENHRNTFCEGSMHRSSDRSPEMNPGPRSYCFRAENMFSGWVEKDLTDPTGGTIVMRNGIEVVRYPVFLTPTFNGGGFDFPDHDFAVFNTRCNNGVVEGRPRGIQDSARVASGQ